MTGLDLAATVAGATLRMEGAFLQNRHYLRPAPDLVDDLLADPHAINAIVAEVLRNGHASVPLGPLFVGAKASNGVPVSTTTSPGSCRCCK